MAEKVVFPADSVDDYWHGAIQVLTGYVPPTREMLFGDLLGNNDIPMMRVEFSDYDGEPSNAIVSASDDLSWMNQHAGWRLENTDVVIPFYSGKHGSIGEAGVGTKVVMKKARITLLGSKGTSKENVTADGVFEGGEFRSGLGKDFQGQSKDTVWSTKPLAQYAFGGGMALKQLLEAGNTSNFSWNGIQVANENAVDLNSFTESAKAFDRVAQFFAQRYKDLQDWEFDLGTEEAAWKGQAAGVFKDMIHGLVRNYKSYSEQFEVSGTANSKFGDDLRAYRVGVHNSAVGLYNKWVNWVNYSGNPLTWLLEILGEVAKEVWHNNIVKVRYKPGQTKSSSHHKVQFGGFYGGDRKYGPLEQMETWKKIGEEAIRRWQAEVKKVLVVAGKQALIDLENTFMTQAFPKKIDTVSVNLTEKLTAGHAAQQEAEQKKKQLEAEKKAEEKEKEAEQKQLEAEKKAEEKEKEQEQKQLEAEKKAEEKEKEAEQKQLEAEAKQEQLQAEQEAKQEAKEKEAEQKQLEAEAKQEQLQAEQEAKQEAKEKEAEQKQLEAEAKQEQLQAEQEAKQEAKEQQAEQKQLEAEAKQEQLQAEQEAKQEAKEQQAEQQQFVATNQARVEREQEKKEQERKQAEQEAKQEQLQAEQEAKQEQREQEAEQKQAEQEQKQIQTESEYQAKQEQLQAEQEAKQEAKEKEAEQKQLEAEAKQEQLQAEQEAKQEAKEKEAEQKQLEAEAKQEQLQAEQEAKQEAKEKEAEQKQLEAEAKQEQLQAEQEAKQEAKEKEAEQKQLEAEAKQEQLQAEQEAKQEAKEKEAEQKQLEAEAKQEQLQAEQEAKQEQREREAEERFGQQTGGLGLSSGDLSGGDLFGQNSGSTTLNPDGSVTMDYPDGTSRTIDPPSGDVTTTLPDGSTVTDSLSPGESITNSDGSTTTVNPDGTVTTDFPDGSSSVVDPDLGTVTTHQPDGTTISAPIERGETLPSELGGPSGLGGGSTSGSVYSPSYDGSHYEEELYDGIPDTVDPSEYGMGAGNGTGGMPMMPGRMGGMGSAGGNEGERVRAVLDDGQPVTTRRSAPQSSRNGYQDEESIVTASRPGAAMSGGMPFMPPMGGAGGPGQQTQSSDRERSSWVDEDEDVWGTDEGGAPAVIGR
ncbi:AAWKG family protein [Streptomyces chartreusis]|uniref:AAWKG family protein n=1 Tax=Streptomyces chartreusis TaxID=1969 RepID=UPI002F90CC6E|nr:AAWKG family protein [Streptomyces chartreusis]